jgi:SPFH domain / Band 7 family
LLGNIIRSTPNLLVVRGFARNFSNEFQFEPFSAPKRGREGEMDVDHYPPTKTNTVLNIVPQGFIMVVERLGKLVHMLVLLFVRLLTFPQKREFRDPGMFFAIPFIDRIAAVHDMREVCIRVPTQTATTQDNVRISLDGNVYVRIVDVEKVTIVPCSSSSCLCSL